MNIPGFRAISRKAPKVEVWVVVTGTTFIDPPPPQSPLLFLDTDFWYQFHTNSYPAEGGYLAIRDASDNIHSKVLTRYPIPQGRYYWEVTCTVVGASTLWTMVGAARTMSLNGLGSDSLNVSVGYWADGTILNGGIVGTADAYGLNDVMGVELNTLLHTIRFFKNGVFQIEVPIIAGDWFPGISMYRANTQMRGNFGHISTPFAFAPTMPQIEVPVIATIDSTIIGITTVNATPARLIALAVLENEVLVIQGLLTAKRAVSQANQAGAWKFEIVITRGVAVSTIVGLAPIITPLGNTIGVIANPPFTLLVNLIENSLVITVTGAAGYTIKWALSMQVARSVLP